MDEVIEELVEHDADLEKIDSSTYAPMPLGEISDEEVAEVLEHLDELDDGPPEIEVLEHPLPGKGPLDLEEMLKGEPKGLSSIAQPVPRELRFKFPYVTCGKLFSQSQNGQGWVSSAVLVRPDVILTCAHCVHDGPGGGLHKNIVFSIYHPYPDPFKKKAKSVYLHEGWARTGKLAWYDFAFVKLHSPFLDSGLGTAGLVTTNKPKFNALSVGFPAEPPFDGNTKTQARGGTSYRMPLVWMPNNDMTGGCSGGPWFDETYQGYCKGLNSYSRTNSPNFMFAPWWSGKVRPVYDRVPK
ncbi:MAG: trypsin-like peptidase domain-containing protein [Porticoccaceae bacterium]|nr:trypsin-like peptidase domain-containing protein [Porticoccaceae bacterium]